jgi:pimeloyl-ACP methyl ester carboxylesterase
VGVTKARRDGVEIAYEMIGPPDGAPALLVMGLGMQMLLWHDDFLAGLVEAGFTAVRFDNRDVGLSTHFRAAGMPSLLSISLRPGSAAAYRLEDMADDAVAVLDAVGWASAHVIGVSMGGMIAQTIAIRHPARVRSLTSIMSTPSPRVGRPKLRALALLAAPNARDREGAANRMVTIFQIIGSPRYAKDERWLREVGRQSYDRAHDPAGVARQLAAINASGDRRRGLAGLRIAALVMHGATDPMIRPSGGRATAAAIPGARFVIYPGMGHDLPRALWGDMIAQIRTVTAEADRSRR